MQKRKSFVERGSSSAWDDLARWNEIKKAKSCPLCLQGEPQAVIVEFKQTWVTAQVEAPLPGYACLVSKRHVIEPFELSPPESAAFWNDAMAAARALTKLFKPVKLNYEIHGNTIPHLHLHLYPRFIGDPYVGGPIDPHQTSFARTSEDLERMRKAIAAIND